MRLILCHEIEIVVEKNTIFLNTERGDIRIMVNSYFLNTQYHYEIILIARIKNHHYLILDS